MASSTTIETVSGTLVDVADPKIEDIMALDIAWALSREPRFGGHTITKYPYSVGQHSIQVMSILSKAFGADGVLTQALVDYLTEREDKEALGFLANCNNVCPTYVLLAALLHDASEAYLRDLPSPVKSIPGLKEAYAAVEKKMMDAIFTKFDVFIFVDEDVQSITWRLVHWADLYARTIEAYHFMPSRGSFWNSNQKVTLSGIQEFEVPRPALEVYQEFLECLKDFDINT